MTTLAWMSEYGVGPPFDRPVTGLIKLLTPEWIEQQYRQPPKRRHLLVRWLGEMMASAKPTAEGAGPTAMITGPVSGAVWEVLALAVDADVAQRATLLPPWVVERLKNPSEYQGARYEIAAAATVSRAGLPISWHPRSEAGPEFWAVVPGTGERIAVEAKSRHRDGTLHEPGLQDRATYLADVEGLLRSAKRKEVQDRPLIIFIDLNLEDRPDVGAEPAWMPQVRRLVSRYDRSTRAASFAMLVCTNYAFHYAGVTLIKDRPGSDSYVPTRSRRPLRSPGLRDRIHASLKDYGVPISPHLGRG